MFSFTAQGFVDARVVKDMSNPKWPRYNLVLYNDKMGRAGMVRKFAQMDCGFPDAVKETALDLQPGEEVRVTGEWDSKQGNDGNRYFTNIYARKIERLSKVEQKAAPQDSEHIPF